jgi:transcriptional regulator with XRE-family HTH domain
MLYSHVSILTPMEKTYGARLEHALRLSGRERQQLADAIQISVQAIAQVIAGKTKALTAENSMRAAQFLQVNPYWLATGEGDPSPADVQPAQAENWPFKRIDIRRVLNLTQDELAFVEGKLDSALEAAESRSQASKSHSSKQVA